MSRSAVELDFFRMEKESSSKKFIDRRRSFRDIQSVISKLNPQLLKTVIASGSVDHTYNNVAKSSENCNLFLSSKSSFSVPSTPQHEDTLVFPPALPLYSPAFGYSQHFQLLLLLASLSLSLSLYIYIYIYICV
ncbi:hypothetical protein CsSME_00021556 [Camellia sinensis var. sinensis]